MYQSIMLSIAAGCLFLNLLVTIREIIKEYNVTLYAANTRHNAAPKTCQCGERYVEIDGIKYSVEWIIKEGRIYDEQKDK